FFASMIADQGIGTALVQRMNLDPAHLDTAFWFNSACSVVLCLGTIALARPISLLFHEPRLTRLLCWSSLALVFNAMSAIHGTLFIRSMDFRRPAIRALVANVAGGAVGVGMAVAGYGVWALVGQQLVSALAGAIFLWSASSYRPSLRFSWPHLRDLFGVSSSILATSFLWFFSSRLDQIIIGRFAGVPVLGLYVIGGKVPDMANTMTQQPMTEVSLPALSRLQDDHPKLRKAIYSGMELNALVAFAVFVGIAAIASDLVPFLFGAKWTSAGNLCALLSLSALVTSLQVFFYPALMATGGAGSYVFLSVCHAVGVAVACWVGIQFGVTWVVTGLIANNLILVGPSMLYLRKRIGLSPLEYCRPCLMPALASLVMGLAIWAAGWVLPMNVPLAVRLACKVCLGGIAYLGFVFFFAPAALGQLMRTFGHAFRRPPILPAVSPST
ncbi:MAG: lipopolysaccharide biosynthesis protein, partial [Opitutaceae bacterium]